MYSEELPPTATKEEKEAHKLSYKDIKIVFLLIINGKAEFVELQVIQEWAEI